jgi:rare lipoprotein A
MILLAAGALLSGCATTHPVVGSRSGEFGLASYYGSKFHGARTASGERFDKHAMTAAHRSLPFGTRVRVTNLANGEQVTVRINDRGPAIKDRIIDLSQGAAAELGFLKQGITRVRIEVL